MTDIFPDASVFSGDIDFPVLRTEASALIYRRTQGNTIHDSKANRNHDGCVAQRIPAAEYHVHDPKVDGITQAIYYLSKTQSPRWLRVFNDVELVPSLMMDVQRGATCAEYKAAEEKLRRRAYKSKAVSALLASLDSLADEVYEACNYWESQGLLAGIYSGNGFARAYLQDARLTRFLLWISHPDEVTPDIPPPWDAGGPWPNNKLVCAWQKTWKGKLKSFPEKDVDINELAPWCGPAHEFFGNGEQYVPPVTKWSYQVISGVNVRKLPDVNSEKVGFLVGGTVVVADDFSLTESSWIHHDQGGWSAVFYYPYAQQGKSGLLMKQL